MTEFVVMSLLFLMGLYIISKTEIFIRYLDFTVDNLEKCLYHKRPGVFDYLGRVFAFIGAQGLGGLCIVPACDNTINFWLRLMSLVFGFIIFKMSADYFENAYSDLVADFKIKI